MEHPEHPSNILYRGECVNFQQAVITYIDALNYEISDSRRYLKKEKDLNEVRIKEETYLIDSFSELVEKASAALTAYREAMSDAELKLIEAWSNSGDSNLEMFAEFLASGDYASLAI